MEQTKHGMGLVNLLSEYNGKLIGVAGSPFPEHNNGYGLQTLVLTYQDKNEQQIEVGITLTSKKVRHKKYKPTTYTNLSAVNLSGVSENFIYGLLKDNNGNGIADLISSEYLISEGNLAINAYDQLNDNPPENTKDLADVLKGSLISNRYHTPQRIESKIPNPVLRLNLGRF